MIKLQALRYKAEIPIETTSGSRCKKHCLEVSEIGLDSPHYATETIKSHGVDVLCNDSSKRYIIIKTALEVGFTRIGIGDGFIHLDDDPEKDPDVIFKY